MSDFVGVRVQSWDFGVPVGQVRDVLRDQHLTPVPRAPRAVAGLLNLRGRIVTAVDLRIRLGLAPQAADSEAAHVVVEHGGELYALMVDSVGDVLHLDERQLETASTRLDPQCRAIASGVCATQTAFVVLLDLGRLLDLAPARRAAS